MTDLPDPTPARGLTVPTCDAPDCPGVRPGNTKTAAFTSLGLLISTPDGTFHERCLSRIAGTDEKVER